MAISNGVETKETQGGARLMTGLVPMMVVAVNPSKKELEQIYGRDLEKEPEYISADEAGVKKLRIDFIMTLIDLYFVNFCTILIERIFLSLCKLKKINDN